MVNSSRGFRGTESTVFPESPEKQKRKEVSDAFEKPKKADIIEDTSKTMESLREVKIDILKNQNKSDQPQECILYDDSGEENNEQQSVHKIQGQQKKEPKKTRQQDYSFEEEQFYGKQSKGKKRGKRPTALPGMILEDQQNLEENKL